jgi:CheY-like chemotaxis protein
MNIILADDDPISRKIISGFLTRFGYQVKVVNDGAEAWGILQTQSAPQLAIFDWMMPRMSGLDLVTKVRALQKKERTYIILLSSRNSKLDIVKGLEAGADDYLVKPCDLAELQARLRVAERAIKHDQQLRKTINELESLARRHNLLGAIAGQHVVAETSAPAPQPAETQAPAPPSAATLESVPAANTPPPEPLSLQDTLAAVFGEIGLGTGRVNPDSEATLIPEFAVLLPLYFPLRQEWVDTLFEFDRRSSHGACRALLRRGANSPQELQDVLVEMVHLLSGAPTAARLKSGGELLPLAAVPIDNPGSPANAARPGGRRYSIRFGENLLTRVTEYATNAKAESRPATDVSLGAIALEKVVSGKNDGVVLASPGDVLTGNRLAAIQEDAPTAPIKIVSVPTGSRNLLSISFS